MEPTSQPADFSQSQEVVNPTPTPVQPAIPLKPKSGSKLFLIVLLLTGLLLFSLIVYSLSNRSVKLSNLPSYKNQTYPTATLIPEPSSTSFPTPTQLDSDKDGLTDEEEARLGTNPNNRDTDGDGFSDGAEVKAGYNPLVNDCLLKVNNCTPEQLKEQKPVNLLIILDSSGSMAGQISGKTKMEIAKEELIKFVSALPPATNFGLMVYGHKGSNSAQDKQVSCQGIEIFYPLGKPDKEQFINAVSHFQPTGWTPIADSFLKAKNEVFVGKDGQENRILLISDGIETCDGNPVQVATDLKQSGIKTTIDVIGFNVNSQAEELLKNIARVTAGKYYSAQTQEQFVQALSSFGEIINRMLEQLSCLTTKNLNSIQYTNCRSIMSIRISTAQ